MVERSNTDANEYGLDGNTKVEADDYPASHDVTVSEARLETVLETAGDGIMVTNDRGRILMYNKACENLFGYSAGEALGRNVTLLMPPRHARVHDDSVAQYVRHGKDDVIGLAHEVAGLHKDGSSIPIELTIGEAHTPAGRQFIGVLRDLRYRHNAEAHMDELQQQLLQLSRRNAVDEMGAAMAHELNQPLTALTLYLQAIEKKNKAFELLNEDMSDILSKALRETERAGQIIQRMRWFGKRVAMKNVAADLHQLIQDSVELTTVGYRRKGLRIHTDVEENLPELRIDAVQIQQILVNLLRNAIEAVVNQPDATIYVKAARANKFVAISVGDSGKGIPEEVRERLFHTFSSSKDTGMGLGLAISNTIAQSHGGYFEVDHGGNGQGAKFTFYLPMEEAGAK